MRAGEWIETHVPARLDRLPWSRWHWLIVIALGATWILDGLEVTLAGALSGILTKPETLGLTDAQVGASATFYLAGAVIGALGFGYGTDRLGRKKLFFITVAVYLIGTALSAFSWNFASYAFFRALTGAGIGGEYAAINSAIDELIPARVRGRVALFINGSYWIGAAMGSAATAVLLDPRYFPLWLGWRRAPEALPALLTAGVVGAFGTALVTALVWLLFDEHVRHEHVGRALEEHAALGARRLHRAAEGLFELAVLLYEKVDCVHRFGRSPLSRGPAERVPTAVRFEPSLGVTRQRSFHGRRRAVVAVERRRAGAAGCAQGVAKVTTAAGW